MRRALAMLLMLSGLAFAACDGMQPMPLQWANTWHQAAFVAIMISFMIISILYMIGIAFSMPKVVAFAKKDFSYMLFISVLVGALYVADDIMNNTFLPVFGTQSMINPTLPRSSVGFCSYPPVSSWTTLQDHTIAYSVCMRDKCSDYFENIMNINFVLGFVSSINLVITPLGLIGLVLRPGVALRPMIDTLGYALYMLAITIAQLKAQEVFLCFSKFYMFTVILPLGIALSALSFTRSAGGALIAVAIGFYLVLPVTFLVSEEIVQDYCVGHGNCDFGNTDMLKAFMGNARDIANDMFNSKGAKATKLVQLTSLDGPLGPMIYLIAFGSTFLPLASLLITLMFIKSFSRIFGAEADFSAMVKIL